MPYRRNDAFRYTFKHPIEAKFKIIKVADKEVTSSDGAIKILDISQGGLRGNSTLSLPDPKETKVLLEVNVQLNAENLLLRGAVVWKKTFTYSYEYGMSFEIDEEQRTSLLNELKKYAKEVK
ncbi:PilZ domain-containing protein [Halalkalibacter alkaliphilus]|uniref:PilZ domain-containing protein n=1 Tax=Halalkalibacter alkaliphilus TaxID=2917993 RepID=A0A9X2I3X4_9BACI|nr:PilZ domain-containing protein [Halalkalibacter alkaliphilus]MCL7747158.1 PilZ domain-containing protein [Halalkalibacter alkaliphilus]